MKMRAAFLVAIGCLLGRMAFGSIELIGNGGFEGLTPDPWLASANGFTISPPVVGNPNQAHSGNNFVSLGNANGPLNESVYQNIHIPGNALAVRYTYFWGCSVMGQDPPSALGFLSVIQPTNQPPVYLATILSANTGYQQASFDLTSYAGKSIQVGYLVRSQTNGFGLQTFFAVDDVSVLVFTANDVPANDDFANATLLTTTTNISDAVTNVVATKEPGEPKHAGTAPTHSVWWKWVAPGNGSVVINTTNSTFNTVLAVYTGTVVSSLTPVASNDDGLGNGLSQVKFNVTAGTEYEIAIDGKGGSSGVAQVNLAFSLDTTPPVVKITSPKNGTKLSIPSVTVNGTATDNLGVSVVQYRVENLAGTNDYQNADGTTSWTALVTNLIPGPNTIRVRAFDTSGNQSLEVTEVVSFVVLSPLTVNINGTGTVAPNLNGTQQPVGNTLTLTAKPGAGQSFSNWVVSDDTVTTANLSFVMQTNLVVTVNFVPNPFGPVVGTYQGLIYDTNGVAPQSSGFFNGKLTGSGAFSAKIVLAGKNLSLSGQFSAGGVFSNSILRKGASPLSVQLNLDFATGDLTGVFNDGTNITELIANRAVTSSTAGKYTLLIPGGTNGVAQPGGDSYATVVVGANGAISLKGVLSDGTKFAQKANLLTTGQWPFYVSLYAGRGSILSWLTFSNSTIDGTTYWFKGSGAGTLYPAGFTNVTDAAGSSYVFTKGVPVLNFLTGILEFSNGNLSNTFIEGIALDSNSKVTSTNASVKMTITTATGLFKGSVKDPFSGRVIPFNGVVLQQQNAGGGFFTGFNQTGRVVVSP